MINSEVFLMCKVSQGNWEKSKKKINRKEKKKEDRGKKGELESHGLVFLLLGPPLKFSSLPSLLSFSPSSSSSFSSSSPFLRLDSSSFFSLPSAMAEDKVLFLPAKMCFFFFFFFFLFVLSGWRENWVTQKWESWKCLCDFCCEEDEAGILVWDVWFVFLFFFFFCLLAQLWKARLGFVIFGGIRVSL